LLDFREAHKDEFGSGSRAVDQRIEQARANIRWMEMNYDKVVNWFNEQNEGHERIHH